MTGFLAVMSPTVSYVSGKDFVVTGWDSAWRATACSAISATLVLVELRGRPSLPQVSLQSRSRAGRKSPRGRPAADADIVLRPHPARNANMNTLELARELIRKAS